MRFRLQSKYKVFMNNLQAFVQLPYSQDGGTVPIRWMSPEAIQYGQYTNKNDVWAFGVTMWEVFSYGVIPYSAWNNEDVATNVQAVSLSSSHNP